MGKSRIVKERVKQCRLRADEEWGVRVSEHYKGEIKSCFGGR